MKTRKMILSTLVIGLALCLNSCNKESCVTCTFKEHNSGQSESKTFCGTDEEIADEDAEFKNKASDANAQYPNHYYTGGCD